MGALKCTFMTDAGTVQATTTRTKLMGVSLIRDGASQFNKVEFRNGTSGSSTVLFTIAGDANGHGDVMVFPSGSYFLFEDGMHATATGDDIVGVTIIYET